MNSIPLLILALFCFKEARALDITGAGSTFVYPLVAKWSDTYKKETGIGVNYQSIGSGGGIKQIQAKTVTFGASDKPLKAEDLKAKGLIQFPIINGGLVPVVHLEGIRANDLRLSGEVVAEIYLGKITKWNDPKIIAMNPELKIPAAEIAVIHRADGSGTSFIWTNYLSKVSPEWKAEIGEGTSVEWPAGVGGKGNEGVAAYVKQTVGAIGYVEYAYALQNGLAYVQMKNAAGNFIKADIESFQAASSSAEWAKAESFNLMLTNAPGKQSWPIAGTTFVLMNIHSQKPELDKEAIKFFKWAFTKGEARARELHYVPLPKNVITLVEKTWTQIK